MSPALEVWSQPLNCQRSPCISYCKFSVTLPSWPSGLGYGASALSVEGRSLPLLLGESGSGLRDCSWARQGAGEAWNPLGKEGCPGWQGDPSLAAEVSEGPGDTSLPGSI